MKTTMPEEIRVQRSWYVVDASDKVLGRLAVKLANVIRGKHKPLFTPHIDTGDYVIVLNAEKVKLTGKKEDRKVYVDYSGYRGGLKERNAAAIRKRNPERLVYDAVRRMLPKNRLMRKAIGRLKVYPGNNHEHEAQKPRPLDVS